MIPISSTTCMDIYEAPNIIGQVPLIMYNYYEAENWCKHRNKRLCYEDEWEYACSPEGWLFPYGNIYNETVCNTNHKWRLYNQSILNLWKNNISAVQIESISELFNRVNIMLNNSNDASLLINHLSWLYQGNIAGEDTKSCISSIGAVDMTGNVEEWTTRRKPGGKLFHGNLKGRYWADIRTCKDRIYTHGDLFRFYEIGFRCCSDIII